MQKLSKKEALFLKRRYGVMKRAELSELRCATLVDKFRQFLVLSTASNFFDVGIEKRDSVVMMRWNKLRKKSKNEQKN